MEKEQFSIELKNKIVILSITPFDTDIDVDLVTSIHYHNIMGEILTCSALLNRVGNLLAEIDELVSDSKLDFDLFKAQMEEEKRKELTFDSTDSKGNIKVNKPTVSEIDSAIIRSPKYKVKKKNMFRLQKERDYINSLYWAVKDKAEKVQKLTEKIRPEDFEKEIVEESVNGIMIKLIDKAIK